MKLTATKRFTIAAAHHIEDYEGKCHNPHGHNYVIELTAEGTGVAYDGNTGLAPEARLTSGVYQGGLNDQISPNNILIDFNVMKKDLEAVVGKADHCDLNDHFMERNVTAEFLAMVWLSQLHAINRMYTRIRVCETEDGWVDAAIGY